MNKYISEVISLGNKNRKQIYLNHGCDLECHGVLISQLKNIIKRDKLKNNSELGKELVESKIYDVMYMGFTMMNPKDVTKDELIKWTGYTNFSGLTTSQISWFISENKDREDLLKYYKNIEDDKHQAIYYSVLACILMMEPEFDSKLIEKEVLYIRDNILKLKLNDTKIQMINFLAAVAIQSFDLSTLAIDTYDAIIDKLEVDFGKTSCSLTDVHKYYDSATTRNTLGKARKTCRC